MGKSEQVSGMITTTSGVIAPITDRSMMDTQDGTYVWEYSQEDCPDSIVQLYLEVSRGSPTPARPMLEDWP
jgi:hypothetical protein